MGQLVGALVKLRIAKRLTLEHQGRGLGGPGRLRLEQLMHAKLIRIGRLCPVPVLQQKAPLFRGQDHKLPHRRGGRLFQRQGQALQRLLHVAADPLRRQRLYDLHRQAKPLAEIFHRKGQWIVGALFASKRSD
jgi:hypothetical protein